MKRNEASVKERNSKERIAVINKIIGTTKRTN